ncbi:MAG: ribose 5-phosphate isomerase B [Candidatus Thermofonsia Clade 1 bacterium]|jgi:ribose 5-phosphate isomerase B|uniref:Ribose 5-phosphate isomerase B n=1 Tax=Candidatus Thermofonsia Clade 1 bacterium TaxID=2364210 RepID=A0A2M8PHK7_9CHLR|nr:MAG: ribose 5-phosphate isomerase B [Candidatus Thermofonsia Clade 1 bacterium]RMF50927.1 MAG: ribose 5-phosphate isomerase B [Chloroflexota bacterium]
MKIAIGCDEAGLPLLNVVREYLRAKPEIEVQDFGVHTTDPVDYPDIAEQVAVAISKGEADRGILVCGTGIGMCITANKVPGVRAALCHDTYSAERARKSNDAQVITMGARVIGPELAKSILDAWLAAEFAGGRSAPKVAKMNAIDERYRAARQGESEQGSC